jgi:hypothetical protein
MTPSYQKAGLLGDQIPIPLNPAAEKMIALPPPSPERSG